MANFIPSFCTCTLSPALYSENGDGSLRVKVTVAICSFPQEYGTKEIIKSSGVQSSSTKHFRQDLSSPSVTSGGIEEIRNVLRLIGRLIGGGGDTGAEQDQ
jgi:hypothetical protein